jgi:hypothetical protein
MGCTYNLSIHCEYICILLSCAMCTYCTSTSRLPLWKVNMKSRKGNYFRQHDISRPAGWLLCWMVLASALTRRGLHHELLQVQYRSRHSVVAITMAKHWQRQSLEMTWFVSTWPHVGHFVVHPCLLFFPTLHHCPHLALRKPSTNEDGCPCTHETQGMHNPVPSFYIHHIWQQQLMTIAFPSLHQQQHRQTLTIKGPRRMMLGLFFTFLYASSVTVDSYCSSAHGAGGPALVNQKHDYKHTDNDKWCVHTPSVTYSYSRNHDHCG